jgi:ribosomal protein S18 acetylase RimI-like enzyme
MPAALMASEAAAPVRRNAAKPALLVRRAGVEDYAGVVAAVDAWTRGRFVGVALPRSFFQHFADTSLLLSTNGELSGVLVGFRSQAQPRVAYLHYLAVAPKARRQGHARVLCQAFFARALELGCEEVQSIAPPFNTSLIAFHRELGFEVLDGGGFSCGVAVFPDFAGAGQHRVLFRKSLREHGIGSRV